jgi:hypothetical protein
MPSHRRCSLVVLLAFGAANGTVDGGSGDVEQLREFGGGVSARPVQLDEVGFLVRAEFGFLAAETALGFRDGHAFSGSHPGQVRLELGDHRERGEQQASDGIGWVVDGSACGTIGVCAPRSA